MMPTLEDVIEITLAAPKMLLNIELKGPMDPECLDEFDFDETAEIVVDLINKYQIGSRVMVSSFNPNVLDAVLRASSADRDFLVQSLRNWYGM